jgi:hypothetical protein
MTAIPPAVSFTIDTPFDYALTPAIDAMLVDMFFANDAIVGDHIRYAVGGYVFRIGYSWRAGSDSQHNQKFAHACLLNRSSVCANYSIPAMNGAADAAPSTVSRRFRHR